MDNRTALDRAQVYGHIGDRMKPGFDSPATNKRIVLCHIANISHAGMLASGNATTLTMRKAVRGSEQRDFTLSHQVYRIGARARYR